MSTVVHMTCIDTVQRHLCRFAWFFHIFCTSACNYTGADKNTSCAYHHEVTSQHEDGARVVGGAAVVSRAE